MKQATQMLMVIIWGVVLATVLWASNSKANYDFPVVDTTTCLDIYRECGGEAYRNCILIKGGYNE